MPAHRWFGLAALNGAIATAMAAVGAHLLPIDVGDTGRALYRQAAEFQLFHSLAMLASALAMPWLGARQTCITALLFQTGIIAFSGSLYWRVLNGPGSLGSFHWITPLGGLALISAWICLSVMAFRAVRS